MQRYVWLCFLCLSCAPTLQGVVSDADVLEKLSYNNEKIQSFRGMGKAYFSLKEGKGSLELIVVAKKPGDLRIETGNFFGVPLSVITTRENKMQYYDIPYEKFYEGKLDSRFLRAILPLNLNQKDLLGLLFFSQKTYEKMKASQKYRLEFIGIQKREKDRFYYPRELRLTNTHTEEFIHMGWEEFDLNPKALKPDLFWVQKPAYATRIEIGGASRANPLFQGQPEGN